MALLMRESFIDATRGYVFSESDWYEPYTGNRGRLFLDCQREYGRCVSAVYRDRPNGTPAVVGWVFQKRMDYDDARSKADTYLREVWVELRRVPGAGGDD